MYISWQAYVDLCRRASERRNRKESENAMAGGLRGDSPPMTRWAFFAAP